MKSFFLDLLLYFGLSALIFPIVDFMDYHYGWELERGFAAGISSILAYNLAQIIIINSKLDDILESRKTDNYSNGVGIK